MLFWLLKFLPALLIHGFMGLALLVFALHFIPFVPYKFAMKWGGLAAIALGLFLEGCLLTQQAWEAQVAALQERIKESEEKAQVINTQVETQYITQTKTIHEKGDQIVTRFLAVGFARGLLFSKPYCLMSYFNAGLMVLQASIRLCTDAVDFAKAAFSSGFMRSFTMRSTPFAPITIGTPTNISFTP